MPLAAALQAAIEVEDTLDAGAEPRCMTMPIRVATADAQGTIPVITTDVLAMAAFPA
jgi:hypothetical protein